MSELFHRLVREDSAQTEAEYAMLLVLILIIVLVSLKLIGTNVNAHLDNVAKNMS